MAAGEGCWKRPKTGAAAITEGGPEVLAAQGASANPAAACPVATWHAPSRPFCATYSLASAVHAFGDDVAAVAIAAKAEQASKSADALAVLRDHINGPAVPGWQARLRLSRRLLSVTSSNRHTSPSASLYSSRSGVRTQWPCWSAQSSTTTTPTASLSRARALTTYCSGHAVSRTASRMCAVPCA